MRFQLMRINIERWGTWISLHLWTIRGLIEWLALPSLSTEMIVIVLGMHGEEQLKVVVVGFKGWGTRLEGKG